MVLGLLAFVILEASTACVRDMISMEIYGTKPHRIPCSKWPTPDEVEQVVDQHARVVRRVENVDEPGSILVSINPMSCPGQSGNRNLLRGEPKPGINQGNNRR